MIETYKMVFLNIIVSAIVGIGILIYYYIYPKKKINLFYLLLIILLLPLISILRNGTYESGDLSFHIKATMEFFENLQQGNIVPEWTVRHCYGYGCPEYLYLFDLPYYIISFIHIIGFSFIASAKLLLAVSFIASGIGMYLWIKDELGEKAGFVAAIFYLYAPYHLIDLSFRASVGELLSMAFLPFSFLLTKKMAETNRPVFFIGNAIVFACLILSHQVTSFVTFPLVLLYGFLVWKRIKKRKLSMLLITFASIISGLFLSAFYWVPILSESKYTLFSGQNDIQFNPFQYFFYSPNRFGLLFQGHHGELYFLIGYTQWIVIGISLFMLFRKKIPEKEKVLLWANVIFFALFFILMQSFTKPLWQILPLLKGFQFSWRLSIEITVFISIMAAIVVKTINRNTFTLILCVITIFYTILNWSNRTMLPKVTDATLSTQTLFDEKSGFVDLTTPKWVDQYQPWIGKTPKTHLEVLSGRAQIVEVTRQVTKHEYVVDAKTNAKLKENTFYYPGWKLLVNNQEVPVSYQNKSYPGVMIFTVKKGLYKIDVLFTDTIDRVVGKWISGIAGFILLIYSLYLVLIRRLTKPLRFAPKR